MTDVFEYASYDRESIYFDKERLLSYWDNFMSSSTYDQSIYVNPFWRPRGLPESELTAAKRVPVPDDWIIENQFVGRKARSKKITGGQ
jgi:NADH-quinone oxidoreductase subunit I